MFVVGISRAKQGTLDIVNHVGAKALAEIGLVGTAPAIASAVFHEPPSVSGTCRSHWMSSWPDRSAGSSMREFLLGSGRGKSDAWHKECCAQPYTGPSGI